MFTDYGPDLGGLNFPEVIVIWASYASVGLKANWLKLLCMGLEAEALLLDLSSLSAAVESCASWFSLPKTPEGMG